jgi:hypothetical protein
VFYPDSYRDVLGLAAAVQGYWIIRSKLTPRIRSRKWMFSAYNLTDIPAESDPFYSGFLFKKGRPAETFRSKLTPLLQFWFLFVVF